MGRFDMSNLRDAGSPSQEVDKVRDLVREVTYERRVVAFYDALGWRSHIRRARNKASDVSLLRRLILKTARAPRIEKGLGLRVSTFSDNVVISQLPGANTPQLLMQLATWQLGAAINGFLMRGGVTIGNLVHEDEVVFGPGLNRAYYLESKIAMYPRIVLDPLYLEEFGELGTRRRPLNRAGRRPLCARRLGAARWTANRTPGLVKHCLFGAARQRRDVCWRISLQPQRRVSS